MLARLFPGVGDGVPGPMLESRNGSFSGELRPNGDDPKLCLWLASLLPFDMALYSNGLFDGENEAPPGVRWPEGLALADNGDALRLAGLAERESRYLGGVT